MRIKDGKGRTAERVFLITAGVLTIALIMYVIWLVRHLASKSEIVFEVEQNAGAGVPAFNFDKYEKLFGPISSSTQNTSSSN